MCEVKIHLVQLLGKDPKELMVLSEEHLNMKITYSKELINLYEILAPCEVRLLGTLCFELHSAIAEQTRRISSQMNTTPKALLEESLHYVEKCVNYLQYESNIFIEGHILQQARINRDALNMVLKL
ncbi:uncharacterized protein LOC119685623 [Teleopsis dalmanni]|nr:uncharacterized protein LOC119685623 [Teleopsis dalmanni]